MTYAKVIADSISPEGVRLTTFEVRFHRFVLAEFNTHRTLSRNSASSRAIPFRKQLAKVCDDPALPVVWAGEQKGMQGGDEVEDPERAQTLWLDAQGEVMKRASDLADLGVHKSLVNRLLEPWMHHTVVCTATAWENFFEQRCSPLAQPEIRVAAEMMREAYDDSKPREMAEGEWHLPYVEPGDLAVIEGNVGAQFGDASEVARWATSVSAARCARVSYLTQGGKRDMNEDMRLYERLVTADPPHWSPLEHVATPWPQNRQSLGQRDLTFLAMDGSRHSASVDHLPRVGNLLGWRSLRTEVEAQKGAVTFR